MNSPEEFKAQMIWVIFTPARSSSISLDLTSSSAETPQQRKLDRQERNLKVRFYGRLADLFGSEREIAIEPPCTVAQLREELAMKHPQAAESLQHRRVRACIGDEIVRDSDAVPDGAVLEFLAPVSGG